MLLVFNVHKGFRVDYDIRIIINKILKIIVNFVEKLKKKNPQNLREILERPSYRGGVKPICQRADISPHTFQRVGKRPHNRTLH